jgi:hypothetical protein
MPWEIPTVKTVTVDANKRVRIADARPREVYSLQNNGDGTFVLTRVVAEPKPAFPPGSLLKYLTPERDEEVGALLSGCVQGPE